MLPRCMWYDATLNWIKDLLSERLQALAVSCSLSSYCIVASGIAVKLLADESIIIYRSDENSYDRLQASL